VTRTDGIPLARDAGGKPSGRLRGKYLEPPGQPGERCSPLGDIRPRLGEFIGRLVHSAGHAFLSVLWGRRVYRVERCVVR
jgi:hypothetical protein